MNLVKFFFKIILVEFNRFYTCIFLETNNYFHRRFSFNYLTIPKIIWVVEKKRLMDDPNNRSSHRFRTPTLGGVAFFYTVLIALFFINERGLNNEAFYLIPGLTILFFIGLKDDLVVLTAEPNLFLRVAAVAFILFNDSFVIESLNGFLNIYEIPYYLYLAIAGIF